MNNVLSYIRWRGDISLMERPFNEVDNLVLAVLSYIKLSGIVPTVEAGGYISLKEAYSMNSPKKQEIAALPDQIMAEITVSLFRELAYSKRFGNAKLYNYKDICDENMKCQLAALHIGLEDGTVYVSFRGTDEKLLSWQEDFNMCFQTMPSQQEAVRYLEQTMAAGYLKYRIGGHSKGGNLAVYASMMCMDVLKSQIIEVYDNDGPGLCKEMLKTRQYELIHDKIIRIIPQYCIIGMLFFHERMPKIVKSSAKGILQHDAMTWQVEGDHFLEVKDLTEESKTINRIFNTWIEDVDIEQRKIFLANFFGALETGGAKLVDDVANGGIDGIEYIIKSMAGPKKNTKNVIGKLIKSTVKGLRSGNFIMLCKAKNMIRGTIFIILGIFFMQLPEYAAQITAAAAAFIIFLLAVRRFVYHVTSKTGHIIINRYSIIFYLLVISLAILILLREKRLILSTNISLGLMLAAFGIYKFKKAVKGYNKNQKLWLISWAYAIITIIMGIIALIAPHRIIKKYVFAVGVFMVIEGLRKIVLECFNHRNNTKS